MIHDGYLERMKMSKGILILFQSTPALIPRGKYEFPKNAENLKYEMTCDPFPGEYRFARSANLLRMIALVIKKWKF